MVLIWTQWQKLNYWRIGFKSCLPVRKKMAGYAERLRGILGIYKRGWQFVYRIVTSRDRGCCGYFDNYVVYEKGVCSIPKPPVF